MLDKKKKSVVAVVCVEVVSLHQKTEEPDKCLLFPSRPTPCPCSPHTCTFSPSSRLTPCTPGAHPAPLHLLPSTLHPTTLHNQPSSTRSLTPNTSTLQLLFHLSLTKPQSLPNMLIPSAQQGTPSLSPCRNRYPAPLCNGNSNRSPHRTALAFRLVIRAQVHAIRFLHPFLRVTTQVKALDSHCIPQVCLHIPTPHWVTSPHQPGSMKSCR